MRPLTFLAALILFAAMYSPFAVAAEKAASTTAATVTAIEGSARVFVNNKASGRPLKRGDILRKEHEVRVGDSSRIELRFPDGTVMRLAERSRLSLREVNYDKRTESKNVKVNLGVGKLWAKVKKLATPDTSVGVMTGNAVAGVRGTVYRMNVEEDNSSLIKVYDGSVYVASPPKDESGKTTTGFSAPVPVPGPHEVPPPVHEVTMEEWHVIVQAMQQVTISSQGVASQPQDFDPKADADDWVKWNQERDKQVVF